MIVCYGRNAYAESDGAVGRGGYKRRQLLHYNIRRGCADNEIVFCQTRISIGR